MKQNKILAFDTSTDICSVALLIAGKISELFELVPQKHTQVILPMIKSLLAQEKISLSKLDAIGFGFGPGSFTGVRLATSVAQGLGYGANVPLVPVSTLGALAERVFAEVASQVRVFVGVDARMHEVYWGVYEFGNSSENGSTRKVLVPDSLAKAEEVILPCAVQQQHAVGVGSAWAQYGDVLRDRCASVGGVDRVQPDYYPRAREIAIIASREFSKGNYLQPQDVLPQYLRNQVTS